MNESARAWLLASGLPQDNPSAQRLAQQHAHKTPEAAAEAGRIARRILAERQQKQQQGGAGHGQKNN